MNNRFYKIFETAKVISHSSFKQIEQVQSDTNKLVGKEKLRIAYIMNHVRVCGGAKVILEHCNQLVERGHEVSIICRDPIPAWKEVKANYIQAEQQVPLVNHVPEVDIIICTVAEQVPETYLFARVPVILFEQGDVYIYEYEKQPDLFKDFYQHIWNIPVPVFGVSRSLLKILEGIFKKRGQVLHNALDRSIFFPRDIERKEKEKLKILFVGQENNTFKGIPIIREALRIVREMGYTFDELWVAQVLPENEFQGEFYENPPQKKLGEIYRKADIFVSGSFYESFSLPPLEAMASGCAVISTDNEGVKEYGIDGYNCLFGKVGDSKSLAKCIIELIENPKKREYLVHNGYETASSFDWSVIMDQWEDNLKKIIKGIQNYTQPIPSIRVERVPRNIPSEHICQYQKQFVSNMDENWCLFLSEDEIFDSESLSYVQQILSKAEFGKFTVPVIYSNEIPGHPIVRLEDRLVSRNKRIGELSLVLPIQIINSSSGKFLPKWKRKAIHLYQVEQFDSLISFLRGIFPSLSNKEKLVACRWLVLGLIEIGRFQEAFTVIESSLEIDPSYSDLLYLVGRIYLMNHNISEGRKYLEFARFCGTSFYHEDAFYKLEDICSAYLEELSE